ncbi:unnamed protein product, partial [Merluccius merluccius]
LVCYERVDPRALRQAPPPFPTWLRAPTAISEGGTGAFTEDGQASTVTAGGSAPTHTTQVRAAVFTIPGRTAVPSMEGRTSPSAVQGMAPTVAAEAPPSVPGDQRELGLGLGFHRYSPPRETTAFSPPRVRRPRSPPPEHRRQFSPANPNPTPDHVTRTAGGSKGQVSLFTFQRGTSPHATQGPASTITAGVLASPPEA